jgi:micrococcal nuclease
MLRLGMAWVFTRYALESKVPDYYRFEDEAKRNKRGLWADATPLPPWEWRAKQRER